MPPPDSDGEPLRVATHNVKVTLPDTDAARALDRLLARAPHLVGLQEWSRKRGSLLRARGTLVRFPRLRRLIGRRTPDAGVVWVYPLGGQPVGYDAGRYRFVAVRRLRLARSRRDVRTTWATELLLRDLTTGRLVAVLNTHLVAHHDEPANRAAFEDGWDAAGEWADSWTGYTRYVLGDMNGERTRLGPLVSCWRGHDGASFRGRQIDHVYAGVPADGVETVRTPSDHDGVVATYTKETP